MSSGSLTENWAVMFARVVRKSYNLLAGNLQFVKAWRTQTIRRRSRCTPRARWRYCSLLLPPRLHHSAFAAAATSSGLGPSGSENVPRPGATLALLAGRRQTHRRCSSGCTSLTPLGKNAEVLWKNQQQPRRPQKGIWRPYRKRRRTTWLLH